MTIRAVVFDLGGTLVDERDFALWTDIAGSLALGTDADALAHAYADVERALDVEPPKLAEEDAVVEFWREVLSRASGRTIDTALSSRFCGKLRAGRVRHAPPLFSDARRCLDELATEGRRLAIVSNSTSEAAVRRILERNRILDYFERVVSSGTEGVAKPDPEIFRRALARLSVPASEALYVGNLEYTDARAARAAGLYGLWLHRDGTGFGDDPPEVTSLLEVPLVVRRLESPAPGAAGAGPERR